MGDTGLVFAVTVGFQAPERGRWHLVAAGQVPAIWDRRWLDSPEG